MNKDKQQLLISYIAGHQDLFIKVNPILEVAYFDLTLKPVVKFIKHYFEQYKGLPNQEQIKAETNVTIQPAVDLTSQQRKYAENELESFCRQKAIEHAIRTSAQLVEKEDEYGTIEKLIRDAITVSLSRNLGMDYFQDPSARLQLLSNSTNMVPTGYSKLDFALGGGLNRREMIVFAAPSGVGKSITMLNVAKNLVEQGLNGLYITLELSEDVVAKRNDSLYSGVGQTELFRNITKVATEIEKIRESCGRFFIKRMPESATNANHIRAYLKEFELVTGVVPDFIVVDYLDIMASVEKVSVENQFIKDKHVAEELRAIANEYNLIMITASQLNRGAQQIEHLDELSQAHIAGGISKINTTDNLVAIIQNAQMKARNEMLFKLLKTRSSGGVGSYFTLKFNPITLRLSNVDEDAPVSKAYTDRLSSFRERSASNSVPEEGPSGPSGPLKTPKRDSDDDLFQV